MWRAMIAQVLKEEAVASPTPSSQSRLFRLFANKILTVQSTLLVVGEMDRFLSKNICAKVNATTTAQI